MTLPGGQPGAGIEIDLGWYRKPGFTARLVWNRSTGILYAIRYVAGSELTLAREHPLGGCRGEDLDDIAAAWTERGPDYLRALSSYVRPGPQRG